MKKFIYIAITLLFVMFISIALFYILKPSPVTDTIGNFFNLPLASINGSLVSYKTYWSDIKALRIISKDENIRDSDLRKKVWEKIINDHALLSAAQDLGISVNSENRKEYAQILGIDNESDLFKELLPIYNNNYDAIYMSIVDPLIFELQLTQALVMDQNNDAATYINTMKAELDADPSSFSEKQKEHIELYNFQSLENELLVSENDFFSVGLSDYFESYTEGSISGIIGSYDGYRIYQIKMIFEEPVRTYQLAEIFVPVDLLNPLLLDTKNNLKIKIFAPKLVQT